MTKARLVFALLVAAVLGWSAAGCVATDYDLSTETVPSFPLAEGNYLVEEGSAYKFGHDGPAVVARYGDGYVIKWKDGTHARGSIFAWEEYGGFVYQVRNGGNLVAPEYFYSLLEQDGDDWVFYALPVEKLDEMIPEAAALVELKEQALVLKDTATLDEIVAVMIENRSDLVVLRKLRPIG